jgi:(p)ppGpp synthase/HD superfamily hydrolase
MSIISKALVFAAEHHQHQFRKGTRIPYMSHLLNVCKILAEKDCDDEVLASALLHDVVEDTLVTIEEVEENFGQRIAEIVRGATELEKLEKKSIQEESTWQSRKEHTIHFLQHDASIDQLLVTCADKLDNLRSISSDYSKIGESLWKRFNASKMKQAWYYTSIASITNSKGKDNIILAEIGEEMEKLVKGVFPVNG